MLRPAAERDSIIATIVAKEPNRSSHVVRGSSTAPQQPIPQAAQKMTISFNYFFLEG